MKTQGLDDAFNVESSIVSADKNDVVKKPDRLTKDDIQKDMNTLVVIFTV